MYYDLTNFVLCSDIIQTCRTGSRSLIETVHRFPRSLMRTKSICPSLLLFLTFLLALPLLSVEAQVTGATLSGTVSDPNGGVIPNATVTLTNGSQGTERKSTTNKDGDYTLPNLTPGLYQLQVEAKGFKTQVRTGLNLTVGEVETINIALVVGGANEVVTVDSTTSSVELGNSALSDVVPGQTARELPLNGRDWTQLAALEPGTVTVRSQPDASNPSSRGNRGFGQQLSIAGARPQVNSYRIDGIIANDYANSTPGSTIGLSLGTDAIGEFSVISSNNSAAYGITGGGVINAVTREGANQIHGSVYEFLRNDFFDAMGYFDPSKLPFRRNQFGAALGGPVLKNKLFLFGNYEGLRNVLTTTSSPTVPTTTAKAGTFGGKTYKIDPSIKPYLAFWHDPNANIGTDSGTYKFASKAVTPEDFFTIRGDVNFSSKDSLAATYLYDNGTTTQPDVLNVNLQQNATRRQLISVAENHIFSPNLYNSLRVGADREVASTLVKLPGANPVGTDSTLGPLPGLDAALLNPGSGYQSTAGGVIGGSRYDYGFTTPQLTDDAFFTHGAHSLRFGFLGMRLQNNERAATYQYGNFVFSSWPNFLQNIPNSLNVEVGAPTPIDLRQWAFGGYAEDAWKLRPNFTVTIGVRYEAVNVPTETQNRLANLRSPSSTQLYLGSPLFTNPTKKNFEPRVGFSYSPASTHGTTIVSGGYGIYDVLPLLYEFNLQLSQVGPYQKTYTTSSPAPGPFPSAAVQAVVNGGGNSLPNEPFIEYNAPRNYVQQFNFTIQQQLPGRISLKVGYVGNHGVHMDFYTSDANVPAPLINTRSALEFPCATAAIKDANGNVLTCKTASTTKLNPTAGQILASGWFASSTYNGLLLQVKQQIKSLYWQSSFTWQKSLDASSSVTSGTPFSNSLNQYLFHGIKGPSDYNLPRVFVTSALWSAPQGVRPDSPLAYVVNNWQIGGIYQVSDGAPFSVTITGDTLGVGNSTPLNMPSRLRGPGCGGNPVNVGNRTNYIKNECFALATSNLPNATLFGNSGRNQLRGAAYQEADISLVKNIVVPKFGESRKLELRADAFNIANHPNLAPPYTNAGFGVTANGALNTAYKGQTGATSVGQITVAAPPRQIQISAKLIF